MIEQRYRVQWYSKSPDIKALLAASNTVNAVAWRGHQPGTVLLHGLSGREDRHEKKWRMEAIVAVRQPPIIAEHGFTMSDLYAKTRFSSVIPSGAKLWRI